MSEKNTGAQDTAAAHMLPKHEEANPPMYPGAGPAPMPPQGPPPYYASQPGYPAPQPGYPAPQPGAPVVYGQPNVIVQYPPGTVIGGQPAPPDHFTMALMVTLFCFCPTGFIALLRASDARSAVARGDMQSATSYSREAKKFINISIGVGIVSVILTIILMALYFGMIVSTYSHYD